MCYFNVGLHIILRDVKTMRSCPFPEQNCLPSLKYVVKRFLFSLGVRGNFCVLHIPNLLVGDVYHVKNKGYLLEVYMMRWVFLTELCL